MNDEILEEVIEEQEEIIEVPTTCSITLADGTILSDLLVNGTNFGSETELDTTIFENNTDTMTLTYSDGTIEEVTNKELTQQMFIGGMWYICFNDKPQPSLEEQVTKLQAENELLMGCISDLAELMSEVMEGME